jgi:hypothetical protein
VTERRTRVRHFITTLRPMSCRKRHVTQEAMSPRSSHHFRHFFIVFNSYFHGLCSLFLLGIFFVLSLFQIFSSSTHLFLFLQCFRKLHHLLTFNFIPLQKYIFFVYISLQFFCLLVTAVNLELINQLQLLFIFSNEVHTFRGETMQQMESFFLSLP